MMPRKQAGQTAVPKKTAAQIAKKLLHSPRIAFCTAVGGQPSEARARVIAHSTASLKL